MGNGSQITVGRRFSVAVSSEVSEGDQNPEWIKSDLEITESGLRLWSPGCQDVLREFPLEQIDGWWYTEDSFVFTVVTDMGESEVELKSQVAGHIMDAMQECVDMVLLQRQSEIERKEEAGQSSSTGCGEESAGGRSGVSEVKRGWLAKRRNTFPRSWQKRYFILRLEDGKPLLRYFDHHPQEGEDSLGTIDLGGFIQVYDMLVDDNTIEFQAWQTNKSRMRKFILLAESQKERKAWTTALRDIVDYPEKPKKSRSKSNDRLRKNSKGSQDTHATFDNDEEYEDDEEASDYYTSKEYM